MLKPWSLLSTRQKSILAQSRNIPVLTQSIYESVPYEPIDAYITEYQPELGNQVDVYIEKLHMVVPPHVLPVDYVSKSLYKYNPVLTRTKITSICHYTDKEIIDSLGFTPMYSSRDELEIEAMYFANGNCGFYVKGKSIMYGSYGSPGQEVPNLMLIASLTQHQATQLSRILRLVYPKMHVPVMKHFGVKYCELTPKPGIVHDTLTSLFPK